MNGSLKSFTPAKKKKVAEFVVWGIKEGSPEMTPENLACQLNASERAQVAYYPIWK